MSAFGATIVVFVVLFSSTADGASNLKDVTSRSVVMVSNENGAGPRGPEGSLKLTDGILTTKFFLIGYTNKFWIKLNFPTAQAIHGYTLTSAADMPDRDPRNWSLSGSNDDVNYVLLDGQNNESFKSRQLTKMYNFFNNRAFRYYRLSITRNSGSNDFQLAEFRVFQ